MTNDEAPQKVRRNFNLNPDADAILTRWTARKGIYLTDALERALKAWDFIETATAGGARLALVEDGPDGKKIREVIWLG